MPDKVDPFAVAHKVLTIPHCPQHPTPTQAEFLLYLDREALYGGAAGGGKSSAVLMAALQCIDIPGYAAIIFRRRLTDLLLPGGLLDRAHQWLDGYAHWDPALYRFEFASGATLSFGCLDNDTDLQRYQGAEFQFIGFDELTQFSEHQYRYLFSRLRRPARSGAPLSRVPLRMRATTNPGGPGHQWVRERFIVPHRAAQTDPTLTDPQRQFFPARLEDNPHLDRDNYRASLDLLTPIARAQLRDGDWDITPEGRLFQRDWFTIEARAPAALDRVRYWDLAATHPTTGRDPDYTVGVLLGRDPAGTHHLLDVTRLRDSPGKILQSVRATARDGVDVAIWIEQEPGSAGKTVIDQYLCALAGYTVHGDRVTGPKTVRAEPVAAQVELGHLTLVEGTWNPAFLDEAELFPDGDHDDQIDALAGAFAQLATSTRHPKIVGMDLFNTGLTRNSTTEHPPGYIDLTDYHSGPAADPNEWYHDFTC